MGIFLQSDLTTAALLATGRRHMLPIAHFAQDRLVDDIVERISHADVDLANGDLVIAAAAIFDPRPGDGLDGKFALTPRKAFDALCERFACERLWTGIHVIAYRVLPRTPGVALRKGRDG